MSQVKLTLRPPPNVDFVHGYPGIPPGAADRPSAAVKGAIEVRCPPAGTKAKWVRIELRKVETLPGGGPANTFQDFVDPSPVNLWTAGSNEDYALLQTQDFGFSIRVPESLPPSLALDNRAGVRYELVASVCTKGKKGFFRTRKSIVVSSMTPITIDKHELHSTWPVYSQLDERKKSQDGVTLTVERNQTCYGPGDKMLLNAIVTSDTLHTVILRGFEVVLRETTTFNGGKKGSVSETRAIIVGESKFPVNETLYGGAKYPMELSLDLSPKHTTTSLGSARHIDINYAICVKALMGTGAHIIVELPVIISNWPRNISVEAVRRIGPAPSLSLTGTAAPSGHLPMQAVPPMSPTMDISPHATVPVVQDFGYSANKEYNVNKDLPATARPTHHATNSSGSADNFTPTINSTNKKHWPTAEEEKERLYQQARAKVEKVQGAAAKAVASGSASSGPVPAAVTIPATVVVQAKPSPPLSANSKPTTPPAKRWPTAEEEKQRLFDKAQAAVSKVQQAASSSPASPEMSTAASLYASGLRKPSGSSNAEAGGSSSSAARSVSNSSSKPAVQYPTAEQEKAALRLYDQARQAVSRTQGALDDTAGSGSSSSYAASPPPINGHGYASPPPFSAPMDAPTQLSEKERMRRAYAEQDAQAAAAQAPIPAYTPPPPPQPITGAQILTEKEILRRKFEAEEAASQAQVPSYGSVPGYSSTPSYNSAPPSRAPLPHSPTRILTAIEEKALMRAKYAEEDRQQQQQSNGSSLSNSAPAPPPLMPRPPKEYIRKTEEEEARVSRYANDVPVRSWSGTSGGGAPLPPPPRTVRAD